ncbi:MAG: TldD/PmbA family protein [Myxococcota bacterium]
MDLSNLESNFQAALPSNVDNVSLRYVCEQTETLTVRKHIVQPVESKQDRGVMLTVHHNGGLGYAATSNMSISGIREAINRAKSWAELSASRSVFGAEQLKMSSEKGSYSTPVGTPWGASSIRDKLDMLKRINAVLPIDDRIVEWYASLMSVDVETLYLSTTGGHIHQHLRHIAPDMAAIANQGTNTQRRSMGGRGMSQQGGLERLNALQFESGALRLAEEAIQLLEAPDCPEGTMDLILCADQMMLQIHESIGHPLELDRILGDERNYAGTSFVTLDMFGSYRYGSDLLNVTFDPSIPEEFASYQFDDQGHKAEKTFLIKEGILERPLGSNLSGSRANQPGVANSRASSWNRPPIDRMANLNIEVGDHSLEQMVSGIEKGVLMKTNTSWSIDDSRNKFQFGCELGQVIENGELKHIVKKPNYRGISATFWRALKSVGDASTFEVLGTPYCGKGEPNQIIRVGHASPACCFADVEVFGGL